MNKANRNKMKQYMITFPQSGNITREEFLNIFPDATYASCAQETHKDGNYHLHLVIVFRDSISKTTLLKIVAKAYPKLCNRIHVSPIRSLEHADEYILKEDTKVYTIGKRVKRSKKGKINIEDAFLRAKQEGWLDNIFHPTCCNQSKDVCFRDDRTDDDNQGLMRV